MSDLKAATFVEMARAETTALTNRMEEILKKTGYGRFDISETDLFDLFNALISNQISLLRAIEQVEARPGGKHRRVGPRAR